MSTTFFEFWASYLELNLAANARCNQNIANQVPNVTSIPSPNSVFNAMIEKYGPIKIKTAISAITRIAPISVSFFKIKVSIAFLITVQTRDKSRPVQSVLLRCHQ